MNVWWLKVKEGSAVDSSNFDITKCVKISEVQIIYTGQIRDLSWKARCKPSPLNR